MRRAAVSGSRASALAAALVFCTLALADPAMLWDEVEPTETTCAPTHYRVFWSSDPHSWCEELFVEYEAAQVCEDGTCEVDWTDPPGDLVFYTVQACCDVGCSAWDHGTQIDCVPE